MNLRTCLQCSSFVPKSLGACPNCGATGPSVHPSAARRLLKRVALGALGVVGGSTLAVTLAACYGVPCSDSSGRCDEIPPCNDPALDLDLDGYCGSQDCDEHDPTRNAAHLDTIGDGIDENCDGVDGVSSTSGVDAGR